MDNVFRLTLEEYVSHRETRDPLVHYDTFVNEYLTLRYPTLTSGQRCEVLKRIYAMQISPQCNVSRHPVEGTTVKETIPLLDALRSFDGAILTPSGSLYCLPSQRVSTLREYSDDGVSKRRVYKKEMLKAASAGDTVLANLFNNKQGAKKIAVNTGPGLAGSQYGILYSLPNYNSTTSIGRFGVRTAYAHVEAMLRGNMLLRSYDEVVHYCLQVKLKMDAVKTAKVIARYKLYVPTPADLVQIFAHSLRYYTGVSEKLKRRLFEFFSALDDTARAACAYTNQLNALCRYNSDLMRRWFTAILDQSRDGSELPPESIFDLPETVREHVTGSFGGYFENLPLKEGNNPGPAIIKYPEGVQRVAAIGRNTVDVFTKSADLIQAFFRTNVDFGSIEDHQSMVRNSTIMSDTDSVVFTTERLVGWWLQDENPAISLEGTQFHCALVMLLSYTLGHKFARMSAQLGMEGDDILNRLIMKNEFYFPVFINTHAGKTYVAGKAIQEGVVLPKLLDEIKGQILRGSGLPKKTLDAFVTLANATVKELIDKPTISGRAMIDTAVDLEQSIVASLRDGSREYVPFVSIKYAAEYADALKSTYFYYMLWSEVFAESLGDIVLPDKCLKYPIRDDKGRFKPNSDYMKKLSETDPAIHRKLTAFVARYPDRPISSFALPTSVKELPWYIKDIIDYRRIVRANCEPFYALLQAFQLVSATTQKDTLASDFVLRKDIVRPQF